MASSPFVRVAALLAVTALAQVAGAEKVSVTVDPYSLIQRKSIRSVVSTDDGEEQVAALGSKLSEEPLHAHLVCHSEGCAEVKAKIEVLAARTEAAKAALADCGKHRQKLTEDLNQAAAARGKAEADLAKCAEERAKLAADLEQCGKDRAEAESGLAACARERAALEEELRQCAEVDRPAAEAALAKCGEERAALEKELEELAKKAAGGDSAASRRRRRKKSLAQVDAQVEGADAEKVDANAEHAAQETRVRQRLAELARDAGDIEERIETLDRRLVEIEELIETEDTKFFKAAEGIQKVADREAAVLGKIEAMAKKLNKAEEAVGHFDGQVNGVKQDLSESEQNVEAAVKSVLTESLGSAAAVTSLLQLNLDMHSLRHQEAELAKGEHEQAITSLQKRLAEQLARGDGQECDETRAQIIDAEGKLAVVQKNLDACLAAKTVIKQKIDAVEQARKKAEAGLAQCLATKEKLKAAVADCHSRKDATKVKLKECLDRKKVLKEKIAQCKTAKEAAKKKLAECLARKDELKNKIKALTGKSLLEASSRAASLIASGHVEATLEFASVLADLHEHIRQDGEEIAELGEAEAMESLRMAEVIAEVEETALAEKTATDALSAGGDAARMALQETADLESEISEVRALIQEIGALEDQAKAAGETSVQVANDGASSQ